MVSGAVEWMIRRGIGTPYWSKHLPSIRRTGDLIFGFVSRRRRAVLPLLALELCYHMVAVLETWHAIDLITGARPRLLTAFVLEYVNRSITVAFQFVPMWLGVDEAKYKPGDQRVGPRLGGGRQPCSRQERPGSSSDGDRPGLARHQRASRPTNAPNRLPR